MAMNRIKMIPFGMLLRRCPANGSRKFSRFYFGRRSLFSEFSSTRQVMEHRIREMEKYFEDYRRPHSAMYRLFCPFARSYNVPIIKEVDGIQKYVLDVDLDGAQPENITLTLKDKTLSISSKSEDKSKESSFVREFSYHYTLPDGVKVDEIKSVYQNGILTIEAPLESATEPKEIPIQKG